MHLKRGDQEFNRVEGLGAIIVTFHPDIAALGRLVDALSEVSELVIVDNGSSSRLGAEIVKVTGAFHSARLIRNTRNMGLAAALNQGLDALVASANNIRNALLLDQDTRLAPGQAHDLADAYQSLARQDESTAAVGPALVDDETGSEYGFHCIRGPLWRRLRGQRQPVSCASLNGSGTLLSLDAWKHTGPMDEALFVDHVDTDWSFRMLDKGYKLYGIPSVRVPHRMGRHVLHYWLLGEREAPYRPPLRHYYLFRNTIILIGRPYAPLVWRFWAIVKLLWTVVLFGLRDRHRREQWQLMKNGILDGLAKRGGEIPARSRQ